MIVFALVGVALLGFLAGLLGFRLKRRWCPECGAMTVPPSDRQDAA